MSNEEIEKAANIWFDSYQEIQDDPEELEGIEVWFKQKLIEAFPSKVFSYSQGSWFITSEIK